MRFSRDYTLIPATKRFAKEGEAPPDIGQISELIRNTLTKEYDVYPPDLGTAIQPDNSIIITAVNKTTGLNVQVTLTDLSGAVGMGAQSPAPGTPPAGGEATAPPAGV